MALQLPPKAPHSSIGSHRPPPSPTTALPHKAPFSPPTSHDPIAPPPRLTWGRAPHIRSPPDCWSPMGSSGENLGTPETPPQGGRRGGRGIPEGSVGGGMWGGGGHSPARPSLQPTWGGVSEGSWRGAEGVVGPQTPPQPPPTPQSCQPPSPHCAVTPRDPLPPPEALRPPQEPRQDPQWGPTAPPRPPPGPL